MTARAKANKRRKAVAADVVGGEPAAEPASQPAAASAGASQATSPAQYTITIRYIVKGHVEHVALTTDDRSFYPFAQRWRYVVANRRRITRATRDSLSGEMATWMSDLCDLKKDDPFDVRVKAMARSDVLEVEIPYPDEEIGFAARLFPWESALALLTQPFREESATFTVVRYLSLNEPAAVEDRPTSLLVVRSGPGELGTLYDLERECQMVVDALQPGLTADRISTLREPDRAELEDRIEQTSPSIVHLSGVDPFALMTHDLIKERPENTDGFVLRKDASGLDMLAPEIVAKIVNAGTTKPTLVAVTSCFSGSRIASLAVAEGARHAIGFLDTLTDADALLFFASFYRAWGREWDVLPAFSQARAEWAAQSSGTGVVLWSRRSLLLPGQTVRAPVAAAVSPPAPQPQATPADLRLHVGLIPDRGPGGTRTTSTSLNYSLLHNDRTPFKTFIVEKLAAGRLPPLQVEVALEVGSDYCRCRFSEELPEPATSIDLAARIRLPLVAGLLRQCTESLRTNLYIKVQCGDRLLRESSERVTVLPADEWRDDGEDHRWLPSFVLPRDPAVLKVVDSAQRYLRTLLDDTSAGFDGYQQLLDDDSNAADVVDPQVQALWAALQHDLPVNYINPPPSYTSQSQRLRNPTEVFRGNAATCIDLALLFASCLEFVGIYPVIFLIQGHAFPGYWRSDKAWWRMKQFRFGDGASGNVGAGGLGGPGAPIQAQAVTTGQSEGWMFNGVDNLVELLRYVQDGTLVPFESTFVAQRRGFFQSLEAGSSRLQPETFDAMIDVQSARGQSVTPLPVFDRFS